MSMGCGQRRGWERGGPGRGQTGTEAGEREQSPSELPLGPAQAPGRTHVGACSGARDPDQEVRSVVADGEGGVTEPKSMLPSSPRPPSEEAQSIPVY